MDYRRRNSRSLELIKGEDSLKRKLSGNISPSVSPIKSNEKYNVGSKIGYGATSNVYIATRVEDSSLVAAKVIKKLEGKKKSAR